jgi:protein CpxP
VGRSWLGLILCLAVAAGPAARAVAQDAPVRLTELHDALHLTADQEDAWRDYSAAIAASPQAEARRSATQRLLPGLATPRRLALLEATMAQDLADFRRQAEAVRVFYGRLAPDQQAIFDRQTAPAAGDQER